MVVPIEREVSIRSAGNELRGTACVPSKRSLAVLMLHGSGPMDRDENMPGQALNVFDAIATRLSSVGIASVRFDKRGCGKSSGSFLQAGFHDFVADGAAWVQWMQNEDSFERIVLLGHSEGCLVAAHLAVQEPAVAGAILLCPFVESMASVLMRQAAQVERELVATRGVGGWMQRVWLRFTGMPTNSQRRLIDLVRSSATSTISYRRQTIAAKWLRELIEIDAEAVFRGVACPLLAIGGEKDLQCKPSDVARIAELVRGPVETRLVPDMTHLLRRDEHLASLLGASALLAKPVDPEILDLVEGWLRTARLGRVAAQ